MTACGGTPAGVTSAVLSVWLAPDNKYSFVELCSAECATVALVLNGIPFGGVSLRIARPKSFIDTSTTSNVLTSALASMPIGGLGGAGLGGGLT